MSIDTSLFSSFETAGFKSTNGVFEIGTSLKVASLNGIIKSTSGLFSVGATTSDLPEGTNLYWTYDRLKAAVLGSGSVTVTPNDSLKTLTITSTGLGGTVTTVSVVSANGISGSVANPTTTPAITISLGNITPTTVNGLTLAALATGFSIAGGTTSKTLTVSLDASVSGTNTGDQTITLTGDVSGSGTGSFVTAIGVNKVLDVMIRQSAGLSVIGRSANSTGNVADISAGSDGDVLRRSGTSIGFGAIPESSVTNLVSDLAARVSTTLTSAHILIGNGSNIATDTAVSGDISITNAGVTAIGANKVTLSMLATIATASVLGRNTAGTGNIEVLTTLPSAVQDNITRTGTISVGVWNGTAISNTYLANSSLTVTAGTGMSGGGSVSLGGTITLTNAGVLSITGTANQVIASGSTGAITLSLPQSIGTSSNPTFGTVTAALTGNASTASALQTARTINGTSFNGTANITVTADGSTLTGTSLASGIVSSSLTSLGTISNLSATLATFSSTVTLSGLTASTALALDASKNIISVTITGSGNSVYSASPTLTGTIGAAAMTLSSTLAVTGKSTLSAAVAIGVAPGNQASLEVQNVGNTGTTQYGIVATVSFGSGATNTGINNYNQLVTSGTYTMGTGRAIYIASPSLSTTTVTELIGLEIANQTGGGTNRAMKIGTGLTTFADATDSTSITTGAITITGGLGISKRLCLDGGSGKTLRITNGVANASVAVTLGSTGPTGSTAGAPQGWMRIDIAGTDRYIPYW